MDHADSVLGTDEHEVTKWVKMADSVVGQSIFLPDDFEGIAVKKADTASVTTKPQVLFFILRYGPTAVKSEAVAFVEVLKHAVFQF
jgi:hypothetical protein